MESSDVLDKNGKEIYQFDIVQDVLSKMVYVVKKGFCKKYAFTGWYLDNEDGYVTALVGGENGEPQNKYLEIIGNIYENPELINQ